MQTENLKILQAKEFLNNNLFFLKNKIKKLYTSTKYLTRFYFTI